MDILKDVLSKINWHNTFKSITDKGIEKVVASAVGATILDLGTIFALFIGLEVVDIFTRCIAMSAQLWKDMYGEAVVKKRGNLLNYIKWMWNAHEWRYIDSTALRDGFWSKTIVYFILIIVAFVGDTILGINHIPKFCLVIFCGVLVCTELLSILENLGECGVSSVQDLKELIKKRKEGLK